MDNPPLMIFFTERRELLERVVRTFAVRWGARVRVVHPDSSELSPNDIIVARLIAIDITDDKTESDMRRRMERLLTRGEASAHWLSKEEDTRKAPLIALSAEEGIFHRVAALRAGFTRFATLPLDSARFDLVMEDLNLTEKSPPYRVLMVDDDVMTLEIAKALLTERGLIFCGLQRVDSLVDTIQEFKPEVVVLDLYLPEVSGEEVALALRDLAHFSAFSILFLSSETDQTVQWDLLDRVGEGFQEKPIDAHRFCHSVLRMARFSRLIKFNNSRISLVEYERNLERSAIDAQFLVSITDASGKIIFVNEKFCSVAGYSEHELLGQSHRCLKSGVHAPEFYQQMWDTILAGKTWSGTTCNRTKSGARFWLHGTIVPFLDDSGTPYQYFSVRTDITQVKETETQLKHALALLEALDKAAGIGHWEVNLATGKTTWSRESKWIHEVAEDYIPQMQTAIDFVKEEHRQTISELFTQCAEKGVPYDTELSIITAKGNERYVRAIGLRGEGLENPLVYGLFEDITEHRLLVRNLIESREKADRANQAKSGFLANISHELRTPLHAILGFSQLLEVSQNLDTDQQSCVTEVRRAGKHLLHIINDILDLAVVEAGKIRINLESVSVDTVVVDCVRSVTELATEKRIQISIANTEGKRVCADRLRLKQVILNLLSNAIKYNRENGKITIGVEDVAMDHADQVKKDNEGAPTPTQFWRLVVEDTGIGVAAPDFPRLFKPFSRLHDASSGIEGTGVGLALCKNLVQSMYGKIGASSELGCGSRFWVELPKR